MPMDPEKLADAVGAALDMVTTPLAARIKALEARPQLKWCGPYRKDQKYAAGSLVKSAGALWCAEEATAEVPGEGPTYWRLVFKKGEV